MKIKIQVFAILKDYLPENQELDLGNTSIRHVKDELCKQNPIVENILDKCRFATNEGFLEENDNFSNEPILFIIPPSSGG
jgi:molybdopterin converting factor small subunit